MRMSLVSFFHRAGSVAVILMESFVGITRHKVLHAVMCCTVQCMLLKAAEGWF